MEEKQVILSVEHLMISFSQYVGGWRQRELPVIRDLNIKVREHEVVAVAGSSGSGKSLLAHAVMGLLPQNAACQGTVSFDGEILNQKKKEQLRGSRMVLVPQSEPVFVCHTCREYCNFTAVRMRPLGDQFVLNVRRVHQRVNHFFSASTSSGISVL